MNGSIADNPDKLRKEYENFNLADQRGAWIWLFPADFGSPWRDDPGVFAAPSNPLCLPLAWHLSRHLPNTGLARTGEGKVWRYPDCA